MKPRAVLTVVAAGLACAQAPAAAHAATPDPWAKVPPLPTACYSGEDRWWDQNNAAIDAVQQEHYRQSDINGAIKQKATEAFSSDPMAVAQRMQQAMMDDPENAQKIMEQMMQQSQQAQTEVPAQQEKEKQLEVESETVIQQYRSALAKATAPAEARWTALKKKAGIPMESPGPGEKGVPDWVWAEWDAILKDRDKAYVANCARWWSAGGPVHAYMKRYRDYLVLERIPHEKKLIDEAELQHYKALNVPTAGWRTTTDYDAAQDYMKMASSLFGQRAAQPFCPGGVCGR